MGVGKKLNWSREQLVECHLDFSFWKGIKTQSNFRLWKTEFTDIFKLQKTKHGS